MTVFPEINTLEEYENMISLTTPNLICKYDGTFFSNENCNTNVQHLTEN